MGVAGLHLGGGPLTVVALALGWRVVAAAGPGPQAPTAAPGALAPGAPGTPAPNPWDRHCRQLLPLHPEWGVHAPSGGPPPTTAMQRGAWARLLRPRDPPSPPPLQTPASPSSAQGTHVSKAGGGRAGPHSRGPGRAARCRRAWGPCRSGTGSGGPARRRPSTRSRGSTPTSCHSLWGRSGGTITGRLAAPCTPGSREGLPRPIPACNAPPRGELGGGDPGASGPCPGVGAGCYDCCVRGAELSWGRGVIGAAQ